MITLYQTPPAWGLPSFSPFCLKVETYLRMVDLDYQARPADFRKAPKGKIPWIDDDGTTVADSSDIVAYLKRRYGDPLDGELDAEQRAHALILQRAIEEHTYFTAVASRWMCQDGWTAFKPTIRSVLPRLLAPIALPLLRKQVNRSLHGQGMGRHSVAEIRARAVQDFAALSVLLGDKPYFLGEQPASIDAVMYGFFCNLLYLPWESRFKDAVRTHDNLVAFTARMKDRYYSADEAA
ncbi:MAG: glutathione S-transferase family protein [Myxococcota bacterium]